MSFQLATGDPVLAVGGFNGTDPFPSLAEFQALVAARDIHYFVSGGGGGFGAGASGGANAISSWVGGALPGDNRRLDHALRPDRADGLSCYRMFPVCPSEYRPGWGQTSTPWGSRPTGRIWTAPVLVSNT